MIANIGDLPYVIVIAVIVLVGGSQLPKIARNIGLAGKEFRKGQSEAEEDAEKDRLAKEQRAAQAAAQAAAIPPPQPLGPAPAAQAAAPQPAQQAAPVAQHQAAPGSPPAEGSITLSPSELDALLKAREEQARREASGEKG